MYYQVLIQVSNLPYKAYKGADTLYDTRLDATIEAIRLREVGYNVKVVEIGTL